MYITYMRSVCEAVRERCVSLHQCHDKEIEMNKNIMLRVCHMHLCMSVRKQTQ